jgi:hypothetical protein
MYKGLLIPFASLSAQVDYATFAYHFVKIVAFYEFVADSVETCEEELMDF